ncbi:hypothetical protein BH11ARM2_BH11ARM2_22180 [soil metagenome]
MGEARHRVTPYMGSFIGDQYSLKLLKNVAF